MALNTIMILLTINIVVISSMHYIDHVTTAENADFILRCDDRITSSDGTTWLIMQCDGNLVLYLSNTPSSVLWASNTVLGDVGIYTQIQRDGNLVIYHNFDWKWQSHSVQSVDNSPNYLVVSNQCAYILNKKMNIIWNTPTAGCSTFVPPIGTGRQYIVINEQVNHDDASSRCQQNYGTKLATVIDNNNYMALRIAKSNAGVAEDESVWVGLHDKNNEGDFKWDDGTPCLYDINDCIASYDFSPPQWGDNEPNDYSIGEDCVELYTNRDGSNGRVVWFNDLPCTDHNWKRKIACNAPRQYIVINEAVWYPTAATRCNVLGTTLATVVDNVDFAAMRVAKSVAGLAQTDAVWVGLHDKNGEGKFEWDDGTSCAYNTNDCIASQNASPPQWGIGEPNDYGSGEDCVELYTDRGGDNNREVWFNDLPCTDNTEWKRKIACNHPTNNRINPPSHNPSHNPTTSPTKPPSNNPSTSPTHNPISRGIQYIFGDNGSEKTWEEAQAWCQSIMGSNLATIRNEDDLVNFDKNIVNYLENQAFIGLNDKRTEGEYEWVDGTDCTISDNKCTNLWAEGYPKAEHLEQEDCVKYHKKLDGINDIKCTKELQFICNNPQYIPTSRPTSQPTVPSADPTESLQPIYSVLETTSAPGQYSPVLPFYVLLIILLCVLIVVNIIMLLIYKMISERDDAKQYDIVAINDWELDAINVSSVDI